MAVGVFVVWGVVGATLATFAMIDASPIAACQIQPSRWIGLTFSSSAALICLPRMFQVLAVENSDERQLAAAS